MYMAELCRCSLAGGLGHFGEADDVGEHYCQDRGALRFAELLDALDFFGQERFEKILA